MTSAKVAALSAIAFHSDEGFEKSAKRILTNS
jgi:hypothetical protein